MGKGIATETQILMTMFFVLTFWAYMSTVAPPAFTVLSTFNFGTLAAGILGVASVCTTSILGSSACGVALVVFGLAQIILIFVGAQSVIQTLIIVPITFIIIYIVSRLASGGG